MSKAKYFKYVGGALGWALGGPIGGILGFIVGSVADAGKESFTDAPDSGGGTDHMADFSVSLLVLCAAVMKADGKILVGELEYVKSFFRRQFGQEKTESRMLMLRDMLKQEIPVREVCAQIRGHINQDGCIQMLHFLFGLAAADGGIAASEESQLKSIASWLGISEYDYESIKAMFLSHRSADSGWAYKILEVSESASDDEVKKAYRKMAVRFHPDKVSHLGEEYQQDATEKFKKVQEAWDAVKKQRGMS